MIRPTVEFTKNLTNVSIKDYVADGKPYCEDENGNTIKDISASTKTTISFFSEQFDNSLSGYVHISGHDGSTLLEKDADGIREGNPVKFP